MKSNPYVYPSMPFPKLRIEQNSKKVFTQSLVSFKDIMNEMGGLQHAKPKVKGKTKEEKIFSIFLDDSIRFGPRKFLLDHKNEFVGIIKEFINEGKPIQCTLLGFPFKVEVPLKTNRMLPDMGEVLVLNKLFFLTQCIASVYEPGAVIMLFTEEAFAPGVNVNITNAGKYAQFVKKMVEKLGYKKNIIVRHLSEVEKFKEFKMVYKKNQDLVRKAVQSKKGVLYEKYCKSSPVIFRIISTKNLNKSDLLAVYNSKDMVDLSNAQKSIYKRISKSLPTTTIDYLAYIKTKDDLNFLVKKFGLQLPLSVSPKPGRLGLLPISEDIHILPYHGVPVRDSKSGKWDIRYLCEVEYDSKKYKKVYLKGDPDKTPFYYERC